VDARFLCLALLAATTLIACGRPGVDLAARLGCAPAEGVEALLARPKGDVIVIDGDASAALAAEAIGCAAAAKGERVVWAFAADTDRIGNFATLLSMRYRPLAAYRAPPELAGWMARLRGFRRAGADVEVAALSAAAPAARQADAGRTPREILDRVRGEARNGRLAGAVGAARATLAPERMILVLAPPDGARAPVGLSGHTWRPLGARLSAQSSISLRAEASARPGLRVRLLPFQDVPERGAALRYDGVVEVGPPVESSPRAGARSVARR
jgi:hypothetical protein